MEKHKRYSSQNLKNHSLISPNNLNTLDSSKPISLRKHNDWVGRNKLKWKYNSLISPICFLHYSVVSIKTKTNNHHRWMKLCQLVSNFANNLKKA